MGYANLSSITIQKIFVLEDEIQLFQVFPERAEGNLEVIEWLRNRVKELKEEKQE
jgi:hypothetical protein